MKISKLTLAIGGCCMFLLGSQKANAIQTDITYELNWSDLGSGGSLQSGGNFGTVEIKITSSTMATVTFTAASGYLFWDSSIADLNLASADSTATASGFNVAAISSSGSKNVDGLGGMNFTSSDGDNPPNGGTQITFTLTDNSGTWSDASAILALNGSNGFLAAAHLADASNTGNTFFVGSDGTTTNNDQLPVPDGGTTIMMLGSALAGLGVVGRRLRKS